MWAGKSQVTGYNPPSLNQLKAATTARHCQQPVVDCIIVTFKDSGDLMSLWTQCTQTFKNHTIPGYCARMTPPCHMCTLFFHSNCFAKLLNRSSFRKAWYSSTVVSANCLQKHESVTASDFIGNAPLGCRLSAERYLWRGLMRCSKERLKYAGKLVTVCGPPLSSFTKYSYFGFKQFSIERDNTCTHHKLSNWTST